LFDIHVGYWRVEQFRNWVYAEAIGLFVVFSQGKPHLAILTSHGNCENALGAALWPAIDTANVEETETGST
jgi:hypothetical protein